MRRGANTNMVSTTKDSLCTDPSSPQEKLEKGPSVHRLTKDNSRWGVTKQ